MKSPWHRRGGEGIHLLDQELQLGQIQTQPASPQTPENINAIGFQKSYLFENPLKELQLLVLTIKCKYLHNQAQFKRGCFRWFKLYATIIMTLLRGNISYLPNFPLLSFQQRTKALQLILVLNI